MSATCFPFIVRVHQRLVNIMAYINQLEGISNLKEQ